MISIIGMACEFAGQADSLDHFYQVILRNIDATSTIGSHRWKVDHSQLSKSILHGGYLRRDPWEFDHQFFNIAPKEAARMDPQHRWLLEHTYHALEDAHILPDRLKHSNCGVFIGLGNQDYARLMHDSGDFPGLHSKGSLGSMAAGRISYHFDCTGPTFVVDTACSSSLVALHEAIISLQRKECDLAIVGGITHILTIDYSLDLSHANMLAQDGRCKAFSKYADGFSRGEGVGVIILQRKEDAVRDNRRIYANLLGSAINGDGRSNGITAPSQEAQQRLIEDAICKAALKPDDITFIEAHGTGTNLGDKIEFSALSHVFRERKKPLYLGSVKANIAHCEAAAGIAGVIKASLCIYHKTIPPHRMADSIDKAFSQGPLPAVFLQEPLFQDKIIAGVSSYGMSGSNAHVILGPHDRVDEPLQQLKTQSFMLFLSAKSAESLDSLSQAYRQLLLSCDEGLAKRIVDQANLSRKHWTQFRRFVYGFNKTELVQRLSEPYKLEKSSSELFVHPDEVAIKAVLQNQKVVPSLVPGPIFDQLGDMYIRNCLDLSKLDLLCNAGLPHQLPAYPFNRTRLIPDYAKQSAISNEEIPFGTTRVELDIVIEKDSILKDHIINGSCILPGSYYLETAIVLFERTLRLTCPQINNMTIFKPVTLNETNITLKVTIIKRSSQDYEMTFSEDAEQLCQLTLNLSGAPSSQLSFPSPINEFQSVTFFYESYAKCGVTYGLLFKMLKSYTKIDETSVVAEIDVPSMHYNAAFFTRFLDNCFQAVGLCLQEVNNPYVPVTIGWYRRNRGVCIDSTMWCYARITTKRDDYLEADLTVYNHNREIVMEIGCLGCHAISSKSIVHQVVLKKIKDAPEVHLESLPTHLKNQEHLIHVIDQLGTSPFFGFQEFYNKVKRCDDESPGVLKTVSLVCKSDDAHTLSLARACALSFPTEFPHVAFHCISYDCMNPSNLGYVLESIKEGIPLYHVKENMLYQYELVPLPRSETRLEMKTDGYYLVTGGFGGIGKFVIEHLVNVLGIKKIIVASRHKGFIDGVEILHMPVDLSKPEEVVQLFQQMPRPLYGIFHLAGINCDQSMASISDDSFQSVVGAKLEGALALDALSRSIDELEYFVLFSSMSALVSSPGQLTYTYANLGLHALAERRVAEGLPATVIAWGPWENTGMMAALSKNVKSSAALMDFSALSASHYCESLSEVLAQKNMHQFAVFKKKEKTKLLQESSENVDLIEDVFINILVQETDCDRSKITMHTILSDLGVDSINTIRIRAELQSKLSVSIPLSLLLDGAQIGTIIEELRKLRVDLLPKEDLPIQNDEYFPLSYNQFSIWYEQQAIADNVSYFCSIAWKICGGPLAVDAMKGAWSKLLEEHDMLRAVLVNREAELGYKLLSLSEAIEKAPIHIQDVQDDIDIECYLKSLLERECDFYQDLPTRVHLLHQRGVTYLILISHHIIMDATSMFTAGLSLLHSLCGFNQAVTHQRGSTYHEFVAHQKQQHPEYCLKATNFLLKQVFDENSHLKRFALPEKDAIENRSLSQGKTVRILFSEEQINQLLSIPQNQRVHLCLSAWALALARYSGEKEILVGIAFNGRTEKKWSQTIGHFVNVLPLCIDVDQNLSCLQYIQEVKQHLFELMEFQDFPLAKFLVNDQVKNMLHGNPLLQTYFNYFDASQMSSDTDHTSLDITPFIQPQQEAQFEISLWIVRDELDYQFDIKYRTAILSDDIIQSLADHYKILILSLSQALLIKDSTKTLKDIKLISTMPTIEEGGHIHDRFVYDYFFEQVIRSPDALAVELQDKTVDYRQLSQYVDNLAEMFMKAGPYGETVAILVPEKANIEFIISVLMLWKKGFAYLPLNTRHPLERIKYMMDAAGCKTILNVDPEILPAISQYVMTLEEVLALEVSLSDMSLKINIWKQPARVAQQPQQTSLAYILFTSGSTGLPKGVLIEHNGLIDRLLWMKKYFQFSSQDKYLVSTVLTFDISIPEFCLPLISGGTCVLFSSEDSSGSHAKICNRHQVTMLSTVPSLFSVIQEDLSSCYTLKNIILVGEVLPPAYVNKWIDSRASAILYNLYGPTEVTIYATYYPCYEALRSSTVPIGAPCDHIAALVLDPYGNLVPKGVAGELYLAGEGVARGYIGGNLSTNPFFNNPYQEFYKRIYRTGDFVRWRDDLTLEYIGRKDNRVKLNGLLIELGEIEQLVVQKFPEIINAAALIVELDGVKHIVLCGMPFVNNPDAVQAHLEERLPRYMLPWKMFFYADFPRNSSNKIDRKALVHQVVNDLKVLPCIKEIEKPLSLLGRQCVNLWEEILKKKNIGADDSFFDLGGDSLLLTKMILIAEQKLSIKINFAEFLQSPTINGILMSVSESTASWQSELQLGRKIPLFTHSKEDGGVLLTGATGHLGIHVLHALLKEPREIYAVVRGDHAMSRLCKRYEEVFHLPLDLSRIHVIQADLSQERFGLDSYGLLCDKVATIIHAAAEVNHALDYARLRSGNVIATKNVIEFAHHCHCKQLWHISTQFTEINDLPAAYLKPELIDQFCSGYEQSKFISEVMANTAALHGFPITTLRLPLLIDSSDPRLLVHNHVVALAAKCVKMKCYPDSACVFSVLPTERIAEFIVNTNFNFSRVINSLAYSLHLKDIFAHLDFDVVKMDFETWRDQVIESTPVEDPFYRLLPLYITGASPLLYSQKQSIDTIDICDVQSLHIQQIFQKLLHTILVRI